MDSSPMGSWLLSYSLDWQNSSESDQRGVRRRRWGRGLPSQRLGTRTACENFFDPIRLNFANQTMNITANCLWEKNPSNNHRFLLEYIFYTSLFFIKKFIVIIII